MNETFLIVHGVTISFGEAVSLFGVLLLGALIWFPIVVARASRRQAIEAARQVLQAREIEARIGELARIQADTAGRLHVMGETLTGRQSELARVVAERLDAVTHRVGHSIETTTRHTVESLRHLHERLAVIDNAQRNLTELTSQVTSLREVLADKQTRGAFGQGRMEAIVRDGLPNGSFQFQFTLSNRTRPDCVVFLPGDQRPIVIDAKFPLEALSALSQARTEEETREARSRVRHDVLRHITDIAERYLIPGETQDIGLMFVPAESIYAELYENFHEVIQKAYRAQVMLVSPSLLMLAIQVMQHILKDARTREAAREIRTEVAHLMDDLGRLRERVLKLQQHFGQVTDDIAQILISADKITKRSSRIELLEFDSEETGRDAKLTMPAPPVARIAEAGA